MEELGRDESRGRAQVTLARLDALFANPTDVVELGPKVIVKLLLDPPGRSSGAFGWPTQT